jgi:hypothetical protein
MYFYALINGDLPFIASRDLLNGVVLLYFALALFYGLGTNYISLVFKDLTKEHILLILWFWFFQAKALHLFHIALIYYGWKSSKKK